MHVIPSPDVSRRTVRGSARQLFRCGERRLDVHRHLVQSHASMRDPLRVMAQFLYLFRNRYGSCASKAVYPDEISGYPNQVIRISHLDYWFILGTQTKCWADLRINNRGLMNRGDWLRVAFVAGVASACARPVAPPSVAAASPSGVVTPTCAEFSIPVPRGQRWHWARPTTKPNASEFRWEIGVTTVYGEFQFGFASFKYPGAKEGSGDLADLLKEGQASVWKREPTVGAVVVREASVSVSASNGGVTIRVGDPVTLRLLFAGQPSRATVITRTPDVGETSIEIPISYRDSRSTTGRPTMRCG